MVYFMQSLRRTVNILQNPPNFYDYSPPVRNNQFFNAAVNNILRGAKRGQHQIAIAVGASFMTPLYPGLRDRTGVINEGVINKGVINKGVINKGVINKGVINDAPTGDM